MPSIPVDVAAAREVLERFMEHGDRHLFRLTDGRAFEGWVVEVGEEAILAMDAGPPASEEPIEIALATIELSSLRYVQDDVAVAFAVT